jgi:plasmid stability protein
MRITFRLEAIMPALQVREFPIDLYEELRVYAAQENRSIAQQTIVAVREYLHTANRIISTEPESAVANATSERVERRRRYFEHLEAYPKVIIPDDFPSPEEIVRQIRDER